MVILDWMKQHSRFIQSKITFSRKQEDVRDFPRTSPCFRDLLRNHRKD
jgi:hypothetical protein